jgi:Zn-dependent peptidase ImmA (M78 family)
MIKASRNGIKRGDVETKDRDYLPKDELLSHGKQHSLPPEDIAINLLNACKFDSCSLDSHALLTEALDYLYQHYDLKVKESGSKSFCSPTIICRYHCSKNLIEINDTLSKNARTYLFALAHVTGHWIMNHNNDTRWQNSSQDIIDDTIQSIFEWNKDRPKSEIYMEIQANKFAAFLLMPRRILTVTVIAIQTQLGIGRAGRIYLDSQPCNITDYRRILAQLEQLFSIPRNIIAWHLRQLDIVVGHNYAQSIPRLSEGYFLSQIHK